MWLTITELAEQYLAEAIHIDELIDRAKASPEPNPLDQDRRLSVLRAMRRENYEIYRHLLWLAERPQQTPQKSGTHIKKSARRHENHIRSV